MGIFDRLGLFLRAEAGGIVDDLSDKARIIRQQLHDAEDALAAERDHLQRREQRQSDLQEQMSTVQERIAACDADVALCLSQDKEDLARFNIRKLIPLRQQLKTCESELLQLQRSIEADRQRISEHEQCLQELASRSAQAIQEQPCEQPVGAATISEEDVEMELLRRQQEVQHAS